MLNGAARFRLENPDLEHRWFDLAYADLIQEPMAVIRKAYGQFGWELDPSSADDMNSWLKLQEERRRHERRHSYALDDYGLTRGEVSGAFAPYLEFAAGRGIRM